LTLPLLLILWTLLPSLVLFSWTFHIFLIQTLSELLAVSVGRSAADQIKFLFYNERLFWDIYSSFKSHFQYQFVNWKFPSLWKQAAVVPVFKKGNRALVANYRPISNLNNFSKILNVLYTITFLFYFKCKLHINQHGFVKSKSSVSNLVTYLNVVLPPVC
jgi:hypothetical protein